MEKSIFTESLTYVDQETMDKWLPIIEGHGEWKPFVEQCPELNDEVSRNMMARVLENTYKMLEANTSSDAAVGAFKPIIMGMTRRVLADNIGTKIFGVQAMKTASQMAFALRAVFTGTSETDNQVKFDNSKILTLAAGTGFDKGGDITSEGTGVGKVIFRSGNNVLIKITAGVFVSGEAVDDAATYASSATTIAMVYDNEMVGHLLPTYSGRYTTAQGEALGIDMSEVGINIQHKSVTAETQKLKTKWTEELQEDLAAEQGVSAEAILSGVAKDQLIRELNQY